MSNAKVAQTVRKILDDAAAKHGEAALWDEVVRAVVRLHPRLQSLMGAADALGKSSGDGEEFNAALDRVVQSSAELVAFVDGVEDTRWECRCYDCGRPYGDEHGFHDLIIPNSWWVKISPTGNEGGLLCPSCICARLEKVSPRSFNVPAAFMSGAIRTVSPELMDTMRHTENLRRDFHNFARTVSSELDDLHPDQEEAGLFPGDT